jgi:hypothetical protein
MRLLNNPREPYPSRAMRPPGSAIPSEQAGPPLPDPSQLRTTTRPLPLVIAIWWTTWGGRPASTMLIM